MIFEAIIITWSIIFMLWFLFTVYNITYIKKIKTQLQFLPNLFFVAKKQTQEYFLNNGIKLEDFYFQDLIKIFNKQKLIYRKQQLIASYFVIWNIHIGILVGIFSVIVPLAYGEFKLDKLGPEIYLMLWVIWMIIFSISNWFLVLGINRGYLLSVALQFQYIYQISLDNIQEWREKNQKLKNDGTYISLKEFSGIYKQIKKPKKILINRGNRVWYTFKFNIEYNKNIQKFFETPERYLYFISVLPYDDIKINYKKVEHYFTSWFDINE